MKPAVHQTYDAIVSRQLPWGILVSLEGDAGDALVDGMKTGGTTALRSAVRVVILDDTREPVRASMLEADLELAGKQTASDP
ncbi:MAG TPA: hypothetical protein VNR17_05860 [Luteimicrobium sp.]|nr:hypothetical protein [Luteimicrobium sp.]